MGTLLCYPYEVYSEEEYFHEILEVKVTKDMLDKFEDQYETALVDLINQKCAGKPITANERPRGENVVDLIKDLRRNVGKEPAPARAARLDFSCIP